MEISQGQESESAREEMISLIGTLWGLYVLCGKSFCYPFARVGGGEGEQNKNSIPGRDLESHNLGREWSPTSFPYCLESQFSSGGWQGLHPRGFRSKVWGSPQKAHPDHSMMREQTQAPGKTLSEFTPHCPGQSLHWQGTQEHLTQNSLKTIL